MPHVTNVPDPGAAPAAPADLQSAAGATPGDFAKLQYSQDLEAWFEKWKQEAADAAVQAALAASREDTDWAVDAALVKSLHDAYITVTQSSIDRSLTRINVVTASIGAVTTIYTALLALVYAAKSDSGKQLSGVALVPAVFLGLALFLVTVYAAMFRNSSSEREPLLPSGIGGGTIVQDRLQTFMKWCFATIGARTWALHAGIVSMGVGVATLPLPFIKTSGALQVVIFAVGLLAVLLAASISALNSYSPDPSKPPWVQLM
jgi:hypothetical protein